MRNHRTLLWASLAANLLLAAGAALLWRRPPTPPVAAPGAASPENAVAGRGEAPAAAPALPAAAEPPLAPIQLTPQRMQAIGVKTGVAEIKTVHDELRLAGEVEVDETRLAYVQVRFAGWIRRVFANAAYQRVQKGQPLFTIYSPELVTTQQEYLLAKESEKLLAASSVPGVASGAAALANAAARRLEQWQVPAREVKELEQTGKVRQEVEVDSPLSGFVTERNALPNMYVQPETRLYTIADLSAVWIYAQAFQNDVGLLKPGDPAVVTVDAYPGRVFPGRVDFIWPRVDPATRTVRVRLAFRNPDLKLFPGMYVNVRLDIPLGRQLVIPASGVLQTGTRQIAFVDHGGGRLEPRDIQVGRRAGDDFVVLKGLRAGERVVISADFLIDSESQMQAAAGAFIPPPPGAGAAAAMNAPAGAAAIDFSTSPSPPRKGPNTLRVKLTDPQGAPVAGADVTVAFFMAAMPSMGMAEMRAVSRLSDRGGGIYEGGIQLESGGTWQVTITARRDGRVIAVKQLSVSAQGGM